MLALALVLLLGLLALLTTPAEAHSALQSADPAPDSSTDQVIDVLTLSFAEPIEVLPDSILVRGPGGQALAIGEIALTAVLVRMSP